ncbi:MAG: glycoside hydrolase family 78 protein [Bacteroidaceae bacterium]|nr:glycoside hydrolase family 78 protein [Bacteroidaceae bacterium]
MKTIKSIIGLMLTATALNASAALKVDNLKVNGVTNPIGVDTDQPLLSWRVSDGDLKGVEQTTFRVQIYSDPRCTKRVWNSKQQKSTDSWINAPILEGVGTKYYWTVEVRDNKGRMVISKKSWFITGLNGSGWSNAQWIGTGVKSQNGEAVIMRKSFTVGKKKILNARGYVAALGVFDLNLNGKRVGREGNDEGIIYDELKAGRTDVSKSVPYMMFDLTDYVSKGNNTVDVQLTDGWWCGKSAANPNSSAQKELMMKIMVMYNDSTVDSIVTDNSWQYTLDGPLRTADLYGGETYDATRTDQSSWTWKPVTVCTDYQGEIVPLQGPTIMAKPQNHGVSRTISINSHSKGDASYTELKALQLSKGDTAVIDMGQDMQGWIRLGFIGKKGTQITCQALTASNKVNGVLRYTASGNAKGEQYTPSATLLDFRHVKVFANDDITLNAVDGISIGSDIEEYSTFECSDPAINRLYDNIRQSQRTSFLSVPTNSSLRGDHIGWTGDAQLFCRTACYNADLRAFYRNWMADIRNAQSEDGAYPDAAPTSATNITSNTAFADAGIIVPWIAYQAYGNTDILDENYDAMQLYMTYLQSLNDEQWYYNGAGTTYGDWLADEETDARFVSVCYYAYVTDLMTHISIALGKEAEPEQYSALAQEIRKEFRKRFIADGELTVKTTTAYLLALHFNMLEDEEQYNKVKQQLRNKIVSDHYANTTGMVGTSILLQTLSEYDMNDLAYTMLQTSPYLKNEGKGTDLRGIASGETWLYRNMAGIDIDYTMPGFKHILLRPQPDNRTDLPAGQKRIDWARATVMTPYGEVSSSWTRKADGTIAYDFIIPYNTTATFFQPQPDGTTKEVQLTCGHWEY